MADISILPSVTVLMPVFNAALYVAQALDSILAQTHPPLEIIVVDDSSTDGTSAVVQSYVPKGVTHVVRENEKGIYSAHNLGVARARGDLIAFLSADDVWIPHKLEVQARALLQHPDFLLSTTNFSYVFDEEHQPSARQIRDEQRKSMQTNLVMETLVARKALFGQVGLFDPTYKVAGDVEWVARMRHLGIRPLVIEEPLLQKRLHATNTTSVNAALNQRELIRALRQALHARPETDSKQK